MSERHPIDDLFRKQLDERQPEFDDAYWQEAKQLLNAHKATALSLAKWKLFSLIAGVLLVSGAIGFYVGSSRQPVKEVQETVAMPQQSNNKSVTGTNSASTNPSHNNSNDQPEQAAESGVVTIDQEEPEAEMKLNNKEEATVQPSSPQNFSVNKQQTDSKPANRNLQPSNSSEPEYVAVSDDLPANGKETSAPAKTTAAAASDVAVADAGTAEQQTKEDHNSGNISQGPAPANHLSISKNQYSKLSGASTHPYMPPLNVPPFNLSLEQQPAETITGSPYSLAAFMKNNHWSKVKSLEFSATAGVTIITVPATKSSATGFEWNALLHYCVNNWLAGAGIGQFAVKDQLAATEDSVTSGSFLQQIITTDSALVVDSFFVIIDSMPVLMYDTSLLVSTDTSYQQVIVYDTITQAYSVSSTGRYLEIPVIFGYRFPAGKSRLQVTGGAAYGWYSGGLRYGISSEGQLISYKPGAVVSLIGRLTWQYPVKQKLLLQAYTGVRYVIGLKKDLPDENYLLYSFGAGLLYRF